MICVDDRKSTTLIPLIKKYIKAGSTIISDCWKAYLQLFNEKSYEYLRVNHSCNFIDPNTGAHT
jgi:hypothetical protein